MKLAITVFSDPTHGGDEALGRLFNALSLAVEAKEHGDDVQIVFAGAGTRWLGELTKLGHPARPLFESVREFVKGASCGCAEVFGATKAVEACGVPLLKDHELAGTTGVASLRAAIAEGWTPLLF